MLDPTMSIFTWFFVLFVATVVLLVLLWDTQIKPWIARKISGLVSEYVPKYLGGSSCTLGHVDFFIGSTCGVEIHDLVIGNLGNFKSDHLFKLGQVVIEVDVRSAVVSAFRKGEPVVVEITRVKVQTVHVTYERSFSSSNVEALLTAIANSQKEEKEREKKNEDDLCDCQVRDKKEQLAKQKNRQKPEVKTNIRKTDIEGIELEAALSIGKKYGLDGVVVQVAPIHYDDFSEEVGRAKIAVIVQLLVQSVLRSAKASYANIEKTGQVVSEKLSEVKEEAQTRSIQVQSSASDGLSAILSTQKVADTAFSWESERDARATIEDALKVGKDVERAWSEGYNAAASAVGRFSGLFSSARATALT